MRERERETDRREEQHAAVGGGNAKVPIVSHKSIVYSMHAKPDWVGYSSSNNDGLDRADDIDIERQPTKHRRTPPVVADFGSYPLNVALST